MSSAQISFSTVRSGGTTKLCSVSEKKLHLVAWSDGRSRSNRSSSSDEDPQAWDGFINEDFRAGGPYVCPLPAVMTVFPPGQSFRRLQAESLDIVEQIRSILYRANVVYHSIGFYGRKWEFETEADPVPTVFIWATKNSLDEDWVTPSRDIREFLFQQGIQNISVEICDERAYEQDKIHPIPMTDPIFPIWDVVCNTIVRDCRTEGWNSVGCYRIGKSDDGALNPSTILVTVDDADKDWRDSREAIVSVLDQFELHGVAVTIKKDEILQFSLSLAKPELPETALAENAQFGQSVARKGYKKGYGTFGGWIQLRNPIDGHWYECGLTCSHVVIPDDDPALANYRVNGVSMGHDLAPMSLQVVSPCESDLVDQKKQFQDAAEALRNNEDYIKMEKEDNDPDGVLYPSRRSRLNYQRWQIADLERRIRQIDSFALQDFQHLGHVQCATGSHKFKRKKYDLPSVLDWALLEAPHEKHGNNKAFTYDMNTPKFVDKDLSLETISSTNLANTDKLYKSGRATGYTTGEYGHLKEANFAMTVSHGRAIEQPTLEHVVLGHGQHFCRPGDSGALVFTATGVVMGMIIGGHNMENITYMTTIDDLIDDIKSTTGATDVRILAQNDEEGC